MILLGVDPGGTTGLAAVSLTPEGVVSPILVPPTIRTKAAMWREFPAIMVKLMDRDKHLTVICEDFKIWGPNVKGNPWQNATTWSDVDTLRIIGMIEYLCWELGVTLVMQQPSDKPMGYGYMGQKYVRGKKDMHSVDALAHLWFFLVTQKKIPPPALHKLPPRLEPKQRGDWKLEK